MKRRTVEELHRREKRRAYGRAWRERNRLHLQDYKERTKDHRKQRARAHELSRYGLNVDQYETLLKRQNGACAICLRKEKSRRLAVDHDHETQRVRGLLCWWCNNKVVARRTSVEMLRRAVEYLESDFDGRHIGLTIDHGKPIEALTIDVDRCDRALAGIYRRVLNEGIVHQHGLVVLTEAAWREMNGTGGDEQEEAIAALREGRDE